MANIIIGSIIFILIAIAIKSIIKNKGVCNCSNNICHYCGRNCHDKK
ncbi:FeoB-associated Cys-rich membrane protein [Clostridium sp. MD294]|nr:FeoB-associated Cys-rich membrane protein [Clostridium sp. MD294]NDO45676.1 FeoB-associated Cys-rich membrane protein [Clostridium sp. MD294]